jgi:hypothetical protein
MYNMWDPTNLQKYCNIKLYEIVRKVFFLKKKLVVD